MRFSSPLRPLSALWFTFLLCALLIATLLFGNRVEAAAVISEVHWAGSDLSPSDEWLEIAGTGPETTSMSGWTLTSRLSSGIETAIFRFPPGASIIPDEYLVISRYGAAQSRLLSEPAFITPSMSLPNSQLLLKLKNAIGEIMDQVDDGSGAPFAGENSTTPLKKASMERMELTAPGTVASNWRSADRMVGWKDGGMVILGTPGSPSDHLTISPSSFSSSSSFSVYSASSSHPGTGALQVSCPVVDPYFILQSGQTSGDDKVTLNLQIGTHQGSLTGASCSVDFDDGTTSGSCNPPSHTYDEPGTFTITAEIHTSCSTFTRTLPVTVQSKTPSSSSSYSSSFDPYFDSVGLPRTGAERLVRGPFILSGVLPNPSGRDPGNEWVEITNASSQTANLESWTLRLPHTKKSTFTFGTSGFFLGETKRFSDAELGMSFKNEAGELSLINPEGTTVMTVSWKDARDGIVQRPLRAVTSGTVRARVVNIVDGDTLEAQMLDGILRVERVRMIGIDAPELHAKDPGRVMLAKRSAEFLRNLTSGTIVTLTFGAEERDAYGRLLAYVEDEEGDSIQEQLLREGMVSAYLRYPFAKEAEFIGYQREAQEANVGMWGILQYEGDERLEIRNSELGSVQETLSSGSSSRPRTILLARTIQSSSASSKAASSAKPKKAVSKNVKKSVSSSSLPVEEETMTPFNPEFDQLRELIEVPDANAAMVSEPHGESSERTFPLISVAIALILCGIAGCAGGWFLTRKLL